MVVYDLAMDGVNWWVVVVDAAVSGAVVAFGVALSMTAAGVQARRRAVEEAFHRASKVQSRVFAGLIGPDRSLLSASDWQSKYDELWQALGEIHSRAKFFPRAGAIRSATSEQVLTLGAVMTIVYGDEQWPSKVAPLIGADEFTKIRHAI